MENTRGQLLGSLLACLCFFRPVNFDLEPVVKTESPIGGASPDGLKFKINPSGMPRYAFHKCGGFCTFTAARAVLLAPREFSTALGISKDNLAVNDSRAARGDARSFCTGSGPAAIAVSARPPPRLPGAFVGCS